jgi:hypothetical protein
MELGTTVRAIEALRVHSPRLAAPDLPPWVLMPRSLLWSSSRVPSMLDSLEVKVLSPTGWR